jgi:hypothetical protein
MSPTDTSRTSTSASTSTTFEGQVALEMRAVRAEIGGPSNAPVFAAAAGVSVDQLANFVASAAFEQIPIVRLEVELLARLMTAYANRPIKRGDLSDLDAMAAYLPYCDVYGADGLTADVARRQNVEKAYGCRLFDSRKDGLRKLIDYLSSVLAAMAPVNRPALSLFVATNADVKENAFAFFKEIGNQAKMAKNRCGAWVELFGLDDGAMPQYLDARIGAAWPFYGLQEVRTVGCSAADGREALIEVCRRRCRSSHFVFVDTWQPLPADFVISALAAQRAGANRVLQYEICGVACA